MRLPATSSELERILACGRSVCTTTFGLRGSVTSTAVKFLGALSCASQRMRRPPFASCSDMPSPMPPWPFSVCCASSFMLFACMALRYRRTARRGARRGSRFESRRLQRLRHMVALHMVAAELPQQLSRGGILDALGDDDQAEVVREVDGGEHDGAVLRIRHQRADERAVDLQ